MIVSGADIAQKVYVNDSNNNNDNIYLESKIYNSGVIKKQKNKQKKLLIKFDEKEYWCELLNVSNISHKP